MKHNKQERIKEIEPIMNVMVIPAIETTKQGTGEIPKKRVCAYCRVSTDQEEQLSSYEFHYE